MLANLPSARGGRHRFPALGVLVAVAAVLPYVRLPAMPLIYDASLAILRNDAVQDGDLTDLFLVDFWGRSPDSTVVTRSWRPLASLSYALQARTVGNAAWLYHATDVGLHALCSTLVLAVLIRFGLGPGAAFPAALLFAWHPVQSEAVSSAVGRADLLAAASLLAAWRLHLGAPHRPPSLARDGASLALLGTAFLCKEYAVAFPFLLLLADGARARAGLDAARPARRIGYALGALSLLVAYLGLRWRLFGALGGVPSLGEEDHPLIGEPLVARWSTACSLLLLAGRLLVLPLGLNHHYRGGTLPVIENPLAPAALGGLLLAGTLLALGLFRLERARDPLPLIAAALFLLPIAPTLNVVSLSGVMFAERFLYLPCAGLALASGWALSRGAGRPSLRVAGGWLAAAVLILGAARTALRVEDWRSMETLSRASLAAYSASEEVWEHLGLTLLAQGRTSEALEALGRSVELNPDRPRATTFYAQTLTSLGRHDEAARALRRATELLPSAGLLWRQLGEAERRAGHGPEAIEAFERAHRLLPRDRATVDGLVHALLEAGLTGQAIDRLDRFEAALPEAGEALAALRDTAQLHAALDHAASGRRAEALHWVQVTVGTGRLDAEGLWLAGRVARRAGDPTLAGTLFARALAADAGLLRRKHDRALEIEQQGRPRDAIELLEIVLEAAPRHAPTLFNLGRLLLGEGRAAEAAEALRRGLAVEDDARARALLAEAERAGTGR